MNNIIRIYNTYFDIIIGNIIVHINNIVLFLISYTYLIASLL